MPVRRWGGRSGREQQVTPIASARPWSARSSSWTSRSRMNAGGARVGAKIARAREVVCDYLVGDNVYGSSDRSLEGYFMAYAFAARIDR